MEYRYFIDLSGVMQLKPWSFPPNDDDWMSRHSDLSSKTEKRADNKRIANCEANAVVPNISAHTL